MVCELLLEIMMCINLPYNGYGFWRAYINSNSPQLNGMVKRSHRPDQQDFYQPSHAARTIGRSVLKTSDTNYRNSASVPQVCRL